MSPHDIYKDQLATLGYGQAIWEPKPTDGTPVAIGDVGYMLFGGFHRLFNIHQSAEVQNNDVPEYFEQLSIDPGRVFDRELKAGAYCSRSVHVHAVSARARSRHSPVSLAGGEVSFSTSRQLGAILALPQSAHRRDTLMHRAYTAYIREHCDRWLAFAHYKYVDVELDDLVLVTGCDLAKSWATAAFMGNETNAAASLTIDVGSIANVSASFGMSWKNVQNVIYNWGPAEDLSTSGVDRSSTNAEVGTSSATGGSQFSLTSSQIALAASEVWDQCIFIRGFHMKNRIGSLFPKKLVAFARFKDLEKRGDDDSRPKTPSVVLDPPEVSDNREEREIRYLGEDKVCACCTGFSALSYIRLYKQRSSLHGPLLDYILKARMVSICAWPGWSRAEWA
ncbi:hypothetical protein FA95DRAFT_1622960 [Auriscalpium vulgare]|uniref:Uncharacterized protein n=1 Tax=Auriscalpium vulgare TaxID=40419 RepID=A0ACB8RLH6_9AGAM|nr:hypothetical protein FA95DRAFT_1622960 [Auriscalpium vulgare]